MSRVDVSTLSPFEALAAYEQRSLGHAAGAPEQIEAPGLWRGIGFRLGARHFVSSIAEVNEILTLPPLTAVPGARGWLLGIANVRGNLVPVVDLYEFIAGQRSAIGETSRVLVVRQPGGSVGLLVDEVLGQRSFRWSRSPRPSARSTSATRASSARTCSWGKSCGGCSAWPSWCARRNSSRRRHDRVAMAFAEGRG